MMKKPNQEMVKRAQEVMGHSLHVLGLSLQNRRDTPYESIEDLVDGTLNELQQQMGLALVGDRQFFIIHSERNSPGQSTKTIPGASH